jgi:hypothetical protein
VDDYYIILDADELKYVRNALDKSIGAVEDGVEVAMTYEPIVLDDSKQEQFKVTINEPGYHLLEHLRFGVDHQKFWKHAEI